jgi:GAF domain-containing protein
MMTREDFHALLHDAVRRVREIFDAEACAVALTDAQLPALHGSVTAEETEIAPPTAPRPRCYAENQLTTTRAVLCVPVRSDRGQIGAVEVIDPRGGYFTMDDRVLLEALAGDIAMAYEEMLLGARADTEEFDFCTLGVFAGLGLIAVGVVLVLGAVFVHQALALSMADLPTRPGLWPGLGLVAAGGVLMGRCRRPTAARIEIAAHRQERLPAVITGGRAA